MMVRGMTARYLLHATYKVKPGDTIVIHAAAGGVGLILSQWAKHLGATVIGTVGSDGQGSGRPRPRLRSCVLATTTSSERVRELTGGKGVAGGLRLRSASTTFEGSLRALRPRGVLASFGEASGDPDPVSPRELGHWARSTSRIRA